jgi:hypothetical protein
MRELRGKASKVAAVFALVLFCNVCAAAQQSQGTLRGSVKDELGGVIIGATVTVSDAAGVEKTATTDEQGNYSFAGLPPGRYDVRINQAGFAPYENLAVEVQAGRTAPLDIVLTVAIEQEEVTVTAEAPVGTEAESQAGAVVLRGGDLDALPDDPDDLSEALQALAGPGAGSSEDGAQIYVDGFTGGRRKSPSARYASTATPSRPSTTVWATAASKSSPSRGRTSSAARRSSTSTTSL